MGIYKGTWPLVALFSVGLMGAAARAEIDCGDGSDGAFAPSESVEIDLSLALPGHWKDTPGDGHGVYDKDKWAVVFKYSSIDVPEGVTVTFRNHPANAPVVWLSQGDVKIAGLVKLDGKDAAPSNKTPTYAAAGPGGFDGGRRARFGLSIRGSAGLGPGGGQSGAERDYSGGAGGGYLARGEQGYPKGTTGGDPYGGNQLQPLMGGSGGGTNWDYIGSEGAGGAGGGALLISACGDIVIESSGQITANGGKGSDISGGGGSGGAIRLVAPTISGTGALYSKGGRPGSVGGSTNGGAGSAGRIRLEADDSEGYSGTTDPQWAHGFPVRVFAAATPVLRITRIDGNDVAGDPLAGIKTLDAEFDNPNPVTIEVEATGVKAGTKVVLTILPTYGPKFTVTSADGLAEKDGVLTVQIKDVKIPPGRCELQLRANWTN